jgi:hypothetical protein
MMTKCRCGNEERENRYWKKGEERRCTMRDEESDTIKHMWNEWEREGKKWGEMLKEDEREMGWMKEIWKRRERIEKERGGDRNCHFMFSYIDVCVTLYRVFHE